jgi:hypothetical protein
MDGFGSSKRARHIAAFPDELMHIIFSKVEFQDKKRAGLVCKQWDQLLKAGTAAARHWEIDYTVKRIVESPDANKKIPAVHLGAPHCEYWKVRSLFCLLLSTGWSGQTISLGTVYGAEVLCLGFCITSTYLSRGLFISAKVTNGTLPSVASRTRGTGSTGEKRGTCEG